MELLLFLSCAVERRVGRASEVLQNYGDFCDNWGFGNRRSQGQLLLAIVEEVEGFSSYAVVFSVSLSIYLYVCL
jgi:hypothetical protein